MFVQTEIRNRPDGRETSGMERKQEAPLSPKPPRIPDPDVSAWKHGRTLSESELGLDFRLKELLNPTVSG